MGNRSLTLVVQGESGVGKSWLADTAPGPRLILDVEGGVRFTQSKKIAWNPKDEPPKGLGPDDSVVVTVTDVDAVRRAAEWLQRGMHEFRSVIIDSLSEAQKRMIDDIGGTDQLKLQDYGTLKRKTEAMVRQFRDFTMNPIRPVEVVVFVTGTMEKGQEHPVMRPALTGQMAEQLTYYVDVQAYLAVVSNQEGELERQALFAPLHNIAAKDRTGRLGTVRSNPTIPDLLDAIYGPESPEGGK